MVQEGFSGEESAPESLRKNNPPGKDLRKECPKHKSEESPELREQHGQGPREKLDVQAAERPVWLEGKE